MKAARPAGRRTCFGAMPIWFPILEPEAGAKIQTPEACFLLRVEYKRAAHVKSLPEVSEENRKQLASQQLKDARANWLGTWRPNAVILRRHKQAPQSWRTLPGRVTGAFIG